MHSTQVTEATVARSFQGNTMVVHNMREARDFVRAILKYTGSADKAAQGFTRSDLTGPLDTVLMLPEEWAKYQAMLRAALVEITGNSAYHHA